jgi:hypothetical protein
MPNESKAGLREADELLLDRIRRIERLENESCKTVCKTDIKKRG